MQRCAPPQSIIATAGHINHGKSTLIKALTGTHPDRLPAEQERGMTIELGYAFALGSDDQDQGDLAFIDCPGHSRFIRQAIAGLGTVHGALLVVAANEGIAAQTREHLAVLCLLDVRWGRVVITKADTVDHQRLQDVSKEISDFVCGSPFAIDPPLVVSASSGQGIEHLRTELLRAATKDRQQHPPHRSAPLRLAIDRVFSIAGHGTVVTGTLLRGCIALGQSVCIGGEHRAQVRGLQVRGLSVESAEAGQRCAINISGIKRSAIQRGDWLTATPAPATSTCFDVRVAAVPPGIIHGRHYICHHGTNHVRARLSLYDCDSCQEGSAFAQLRLEQGLAAEVGDRIILRRASPSATVAGAHILAVDAPRHRRYHSSTRSWFADLHGSQLRRLLNHLESRWPQPGTPASCQRALGSETGLAQACAEAGATVIIRKNSTNTIFWSRNGWQRLAQVIREGCRHAQRQGHCWHPFDRLRHNLLNECPEEAFRDRLQALQNDGAILLQKRLCCDPSCIADLPQALMAAACRQLAVLTQAGLQPGYDHPRWSADPDPKAAQRAQSMAEERGWLIRLDDRRCLHRVHCEHALHTIARALREYGSIDIQWFKQHLGLTRRDAIPLAEWCDQHGITTRQGGQRVSGPQSDPQEALPPLLAPLPEI